MKNSGLRWFLVGAVLLAVGAFFVFHLGEYLTLDSLKSNQAALADYYERNRFLTIAAYVGVYLLVTALSLPGATILTLAGGATFGVLLGTLIVSFTSSLGATLAFLASRFLFRGAMEARFQDKIARINEGIEKEGAFYLFALRLIPVFPFFMVNLVMGLTKIPARTFYVVSQAGMFLGTIAYVNAGTQLGTITSLRGVLSAPVLLSFAALGVVPFLAGKVVAAFRGNRLLKRYPKPTRFEYNMVVLGAGSAGLVSAFIASAVKAKVALIEKHRMGGDCLNTGCVPSKALIRSAKQLSYARRAREFGFRSAAVDFDFGEVMERVQRVIGKVEPHDSRERYTGLGVECVEGEARILSPYEVRVGDRTLTTKNIVVATGGRPAVPSIPGLDTIPYWTSDTVWEMRKLPRRLLVLGGGPIGCELAQSFQRFGAQVIQVERGPRIMPREDDDASDFIMEKFRKEGVRLLLRHQARRFVTENGQRILICEHEGAEVRVEFDEVLLALGRQANVKGFGLEELGVELAKNGTVAADDFLRTNYPNIYVCGDVTGPFQFTHVAAHQAWFAAVNALFSPFKAFKVDYRVIPWATFTDPEVARVGLNEKEAKERKIAYEKAVYPLEDLDRAIAEEEDHGFVKVLTVPGKDRILGVTIVGAHSGDTIAEYVTAMKHGLGLNKILGTIHIYPTFSESNKYAAGVWKKAHAPAKALQVLEKFHSWRRS